MGVHLGSEIPSDPNSRGAIGGLNGFGGGIGSALAQGFSGLITGIGNAIMGVFTPGDVFSPIGDAMNTQRKNQEIALAANQSQLAESIDKAQFYGATWRTTSTSAGGGGSSFTASNTQWSYLALDKNTGPLKGCHISPEGLLILDRKGLWEISVKVKGYSKESTHRRYLYTYVTQPGYTPPRGLQSSVDAYGTPFFWSDGSYVIVERNGIVYSQPSDLDMAQSDTFMVNIPSPGYGLMIVFSGMEVKAGPATTLLTASLMDTSVLAEVVSGES